MAQLLMNDAFAFSALKLPIEQELFGHVLEALQVIDAIKVSTALLEFKMLIQREGDARLHEFRRRCTNFC